MSFEDTIDDFDFSVDSLVGNRCAVSRFCFGLLIFISFDLQFFDDSAALELINLLPEVSLSDEPPAQQPAPATVEPAGEISPTFACLCAHRISHGR